jgi:sugar lactone lactonase YvrE
LCCTRHLYPIPTLPFVQTEKRTKQGKAMKFMKRNLPVLHFLFAILAFGLLTGCEMTTSVATQDTQESAKIAIVSTIAGGEYGFAGGKINYADGIGNNAKFDHPSGIAVDAVGNLYVADSNNNRIRKITPAGEVSTLAGGEKGFSDGVGSDARFDHPFGITIDAAGNLYVTDRWNHRIRKITPAGEVSTFAGGEEGFADGVGGAARFHYPSDIAIDAAGTLYVADTVNDRIRKITPAGEVSTLAGGEEGFADGVGDDAKFNRPSGIAGDAAGNLYVVDTENHRIRKITPAGEVSTLAGGGTDDTGIDARFYLPSGIAVDAAGNLYVTDGRYNCIRKITPTGEVSTFVGCKRGLGDGITRPAKFGGIAIDAAGNLYVADSNNNRIRKITPGGEASTLAGGTYGFADGIGGSAKFNRPKGIAIDAAANLYVADSGNYRIRKITPAGEVSTLAGDERGFADGIGINAKFAHPSGIAIDAAGHLYVADSAHIALASSNSANNDRIRKITPAGEVSTLAGGKVGFADGVGSDARFNEPVGIAIDAAGNLYVADTRNDSIRKITPAGEVSTLAGGWTGFAGGWSGFAGEWSGFADGVGRDARFRSPHGIAIDAAGNLYVADAWNHRIRKITPAGEVSTLAGSEKGFADGVGSDAKFYWPSGIAIDAAGNLYVADYRNHRIRKITPAGEVSTLAGSEEGFADGVGSDARFRLPEGIAIDAAGNLYVADSGNNRIRKIEIRRP